MKRRELFKIVYMRMNNLSNNFHHIHWTKFNQFSLQKNLVSKKKYSDQMVTFYIHHTQRLSIRKQQ